MLLQDQRAVVMDGIESHLHVMNFEIHPVHQAQRGGLEAILPSFELLLTC